MDLAHSSKGIRSEYSASSNEVYRNVLAVRLHLVEHQFEHCLDSRLSGIADRLVKVRDQLGIADIRCFVSSDHDIRCCQGRPPKAERFVDLVSD